jgi:FkbM family methyltransferase
MLRRLKVLIASRDLFHNWLLAGVKYFLVKHGLSKGDVIVKCNGDVITLNPNVYSFIVIAYHDGVLRDVYCDKVLRGRLWGAVDLVILMDGRAFLRIDNRMTEVDLEVLADLIRRTLSRYIRGWRYDNSCDCWVRGNVRFKHWHNSILDVFDYGHWDGLNVEDKVVVDVGAFIGDSSIYFALRGASRVIAIEPHPEAYKVMVENIRLNGLEDVITPINAGLSSKPGVICIKNVDVEGTFGTYHGLSECDTAVPAITLADLIDKYDVSRDVVLKMDCEGCEYDVILNDYEHVKLFNEIAFEYHKGAAGKLLKVLVRDYNCSHVARYRVVYCTRKRV